MTINGAKRMIAVEGLPEMPIQSLRISDVTGTGKAGMTAIYADGLELHNVEMNPAAGPAFTATHVRNLELDDVAERKPLVDAPVIRLDDAAGAIVRNSRAFAGTGVFLSAGKEHLNQITLEGNALGAATIPTE